MSTNKFEYWPSNGQLGSTKFTMPTNAEDWPSGDALVGNFVYSEGKLVDFIDIKGLTPNTSKSTTIPYDYVNIELPFAEDAMTINRGPRNKYFYVTFNENVVEGINGDYMLANMETTNLFDFTPLIDEEIDSVSLDKYTSANHMFTGRFIQSGDQLVKLHDLFRVFYVSDESLTPPPMRISSDTCLGIIFGGNIEDDEDGSAFNGSIEGEYYLRDMPQEVDIIGGKADIEIENKIYHYDSNYNTNGFLHMRKLSFKNENYPYFILIYGEQLKDMPKPMSNE